MADLTVHPIGYYHGEAKYPYDVPRQGSIADACGVIELQEGQNYEMALEQLDGFGYVWLIFWFHHNETWHPKVRPPRHTDEKVGVFACRSPHRPNPIGISAVKLLKVEGRRLWVENCDLLDGTPILDIKPYLPYADAFPDAAAGWTEKDDKNHCQVKFTELAIRQLDWLEQNGVPCIRKFIVDRLEYEPENRGRHRLVDGADGQIALAYRTWRAEFAVDENIVLVKKIYSGYSDDDLLGDDRYHDMDVHHQFRKFFG